MTQAHKRGFTLIELLVVISIIVLLVGIIGPSISSIRNLSFKAKSTAAIQELAAGAMQYKSEYNYYPLQPSIPDSGTYNSQASAAFGKLMLGYTTVMSGSTFKFRSDSSTYERTPLVPESTDRFVLNTSTTIKTNRKTDTTVSVLLYTPLDQWKKGDEMAILYYPSTIGNDGTALSDVFAVSCNDTYTASTSLTNFSSKLQDTKFGTTKIVNSDSFLLIAPGIDGEYFTDDDVKNF
ncbi:MAG TPA: prepilin-type N-terminal cleavage/methylation domain-containing protein [Phycisphaerae bacterium]|nr:prepilin-type N-terminal cleavage/methylation domain-containing protein [Phycisphaerae bacterium]HPS52298.1 prepilin-type N-terminal cleavage/methylation domain-containing protein [Phycisphaerae bacterium]